MKTKSIAVAAGLGLTVALAAGAATAGTFAVDLTHPIGTFAPTNGDMTKPDLSKPIKNSIAVPTFGAQATYERTPDFKTNQGYFALGRFMLSEHHGTHLDTPTHYNNNPESLETKTPDKRSTELLGTYDLMGPIVFIDISSRVQSELDRNGGKPNADKKVTDFSNATNNVVTAQDINAVADRLGNGSWIVVNGGWSRFYRGPDLGTSPYINGWNYPGFSKAACDRLIEIEDARGIRINGLVMDNIGIDSGDSSAGDKGDLVVNSWHCHVRGLQRGWKFVENANNLGALAEAKPDSCSLFVGAPKLVGATGGPSRVMAVCEN